MVPTMTGRSVTADPSLRLQTVQVSRRRGRLECNYFICDDSTATHSAALDGMDAPAVGRRHEREPEHADRTSVKTGPAGARGSVTRARSNSVTREPGLPGRNLVPPAGLEPAHTAPEADALSAELRGRVTDRN